MRRRARPELNRIATAALLPVAVAAALAGCGGSGSRATTGHPAAHAGHLAAGNVRTRLAQRSAQVQAVVAMCEAQVGSADRAAIIKCLHQHELQGGP
jgi:hypothetical protein